MIRIATPTRQTTPRQSQSREHMDALLLAGEIRENLRRMYWPKTMKMKPEEVVRLLNQANVRFVLMGTYGINGYRDQARATQDVDVLVRIKDHEKAVQAVRERFPKLQIVDLPVVTRFTDPANDKPLIDLMKPMSDSLLAVFKYSVMVEKSHRVPDLEMALVSKFAAMVSPNRIQSKKLVDGGDFVNIVENNLASIDKRKLRRLAEQVYRGGGKEIMQLLADIEAGRRIVF
jgi:hypothetical protein